MGRRQKMVEPQNALEVALLPHTGAAASVELIPT
jgi:hypothetical protein